MKISEDSAVGAYWVFYSKGPVFEELALWKEWACFQHYHFYRCLVYCECLDVGFFVCFPWGPQLFLGIINIYFKTESVVMMGDVY